MQVEWRLLQRLPSLPLAQVNESLAALLSARQGSLALYRQVAVRCTQLCADAEATDVERTVTMLAGIGGHHKEIADLYAAALPKVKGLMPTLPADRAAKLAIAYASSGLVDTAFYALCNAVLKPTILTLPVDLAVKVGHWLAPHQLPLPAADSLFPQLETLHPLTAQQTLQLLQAFAAAGKGSMDFLRRAADSLLRADLDDRAKSAALHFLCRTGVTDAAVLQRLETVARDFAEVSLLVAAGFDFASVNYRPQALLEAMQQRAAEMWDVRDALCAQWTYHRLGVPLPQTLSRQLAFLLLRSGDVKSYLLSRRLLSHQSH